MYKGGILLQVCNGNCRKLYKIYVDFKTIFYQVKGKLVGNPLTFRQLA